MQQRTLAKAALACFTAVDRALRQDDDPRIPAGTQLMMFAAEGLVRAHVRGMERGITSYEGMVSSAFTRLLSLHGHQGAAQIAEPDSWLLDSLSGCDLSPVTLPEPVAPIGAGGEVESDFDAVLMVGFPVGLAFAGQPQTAKRIGAAIGEQTHMPAEYRDALRALSGLVANLVGRNLSAEEGVSDNEQPARPMTAPGDEVNEGASPTTRWLLVSAVRSGLDALGRIDHVVQAFETCVDEALQCLAIAIAGVAANDVQSLSRHFPGY